MTSYKTGAGAMQSPDTLTNYRIVVALVMGTFFSSLVFSAFGFVTLGLSKGLPLPLAILIPLWIDLPILAYTRAGLIQSWRGQRGRKAVAIAGVAVLSLGSSAMQFIHAFNTYGLGTLSDVSMVALFTGAPLVVLLSTEIWMGLVTRTKGQAQENTEPATPRVRATTVTTLRIPTGKREADPAMAGKPGYSKYGVKMGPPSKSERASINA
jgi:hypothetical protein